MPLHVRCSQTFDCLSRFFTLDSRHHPCCCRPLEILSVLRVARCRRRHLEPLDDAARPVSVLATLRQRRHLRPLGPFPLRSRTATAANEHRAPPRVVGSIFARHLKAWDCFVPFLLSSASALELDGIHPRDQLPSKISFHAHLYAELRKRPMAPPPPPPFLPFVRMDDQHFACRRVGHLYRMTFVPGWGLLSPLQGPSRTWAVFFFGCVTRGHWSLMLFA